MTKGLMKALILLGILTVVVFPARQTPADTSYGVKAGLNFANFIGGDVQDTSYKRGYCGGVVINYNLIPLISLQPEFLYTMKGAEANGGDYSIAYLEIPFLVKLHIPVPFLMIPDLYAGPYGSLKVSAESSLTTGYDDQIERLDYGLVFGGGFDIDLVALKITIEARYDWGMQDIYKNSNEVKNSVFSIIAGILF